MPAFHILRLRSARRPSAIVVGAIALAALAACGDGAAAPAAPANAQGQQLSYSAWRITPATASITGALPAADPSNLYVAKALAAHTDMTTYWGGARAAPRIRTFWFVPTAATIGARSVQPGLYLSDSLPASGAGGSQPTLFAFATPQAGGSYDDTALNWTWSVAGTAPSNATIAAQYETNYPNPYVAQPCLGQDVAPYVYQKVNFVQSGNSGSGTITYVFRAVQASCLRPRAVQATWQLVIPFTATRVL